jgi:hypothetical protein
LPPGVGFGFGFGLPVGLNCGIGSRKKKKAHGIERLYISWDIIEQLIDVTLTGPHWPLLTFTDFMTDVDIVESTRRWLRLRGSGFRDEAE